MSNNYYKVSQWPQSIALVFPFDDRDPASRAEAFAKCAHAAGGQRIAVYRSFMGNRMPLVGES